MGIILRKGECWSKSQNNTNCSDKKAIQLASNHSFDMILR